MTPHVRAHLPAKLLVRLKTLFPQSDLCTHHCTASLGQHPGLARRRAKFSPHIRILFLAAFAAILVQGAGSSETWTLTTIAGDGTEGHQDGNTPASTQFGFIDAKEYPDPWLIGVTVMEDDKTVLLVDNYNQAIRMIDLRTSETTTLVSTKLPCEPNKCQCGSDLTAECGDPRRHVKAAQLSGIVSFRSTAYFSNRWNEERRDTSLPRIYSLNVKAAQILPIPIMHSMPTTNITFAPFGLAKGRTAAEIIFTNYGASISMINIFSGEITYLAGPAIRGLPGEVAGYQDGFGRQVQVASPMGIATDKRQQFSYFVDSMLCNVRKLDLTSFGVTTLVGPSQKSSLGDFQCGYVDGVGSAIRFGRLMGIATLAGNRLVVTERVDHVVRIIDLDDLSSKTVGGLRGYAGWVDGQQREMMRFNIPSAVAASSNGGTLLVTDQGSNRVRVLQKLCSPFYIGTFGHSLALLWVENEPDSF